METTNLHIMTRAIIRDSLIHPNVGELRKEDVHEYLWERQTAGVPDGAIGEEDIMSEDEFNKATDLIFAELQEIITPPENAADSKAQNADKECDTCSHWLIQGGKCEYGHRTTERGECGDYWDGEPVTDCPKCGRNMVIDTDADAPYLSCRHQDCDNIDTYPQWN